ncbi:MAG TPA: hypothetical protein VK911_06455 [Vicinamibacterales bacterium]|nr:hypothetical protein [Vicinamibacterales bacterium]
MTTPPVRVLKFGGTSVATAASRDQAIGHLRRARDEGRQVAVVVSAMGRRGDAYATDTLLDLLRGDGGPVAPGDYDLMFTCGEAIAAAVMAHAVKRAGIESVALTSAQARIFTDGRHMESEIVRIDPDRLHALLRQGVVPVITGGQGVAEDTLDYTSLGRGGSDTSAVAVGVALGAERVDIFTDVAGIAVCDPRIVPDAPFMHRISYAAMLELARFGARVMHPGAIATAGKAGMPVVVRSTFSTDDGGTTIDGAGDDRPLVGLAVLRGIEQPARPGRLAAWLSVVGAEAAVAAAQPQLAAALAGARVEVLSSEVTPHRCTIAVPDAAADLAARIVYAAAWAQGPTTSPL